MIDEQSILMRPGGQRDALRQLIANLPKRNDMLGAEIGSYMGESAELFIQSWKFKTFYCIDPWEAGYDSGDIASNRGCFDEIEAIFDARVSAYPPIVKIKAKSVDATGKFSDGSLDFVYLDGDHRHDTVVADLAAWIPKLKPSGFIGGHDWSWSDASGKLADAVLKAIYPRKPKMFDDGNWLCFMGCCAHAIPNPDCPTCNYDGALANSFSITTSDAKPSGIDSERP